MFELLLVRAGSRAIQPELLHSISLARQLRSRDEPALIRQLAQDREEVPLTGTVPPSPLRALSELGRTNQVFEVLERASFNPVFDPAVQTPPTTAKLGSIFASSNIAMQRDVRFVSVCARLGLCDYWLATDRWPDSAEDGALPYDFKYECRRLAGAAA